MKNFQFFVYSGANFERSGYLSSGARLFIQELKDFVQQHSAYNGEKKTTGIAGSFLF